MPTVIIEEIKLKNWMQFEKATIKLGTAPGKNICVITGRNGAGKTNLIRAILWCLYKTHPYAACGRLKGPICTARALKRGGKAGTEVSVSLILSCGPEKIEITRSYKALSTSKGGETAAAKSHKVQAFLITPKARNPLPAAKTIARLFPKSAAPLCFVDPYDFRHAYPAPYPLSAGDIAQYGYARLLSDRQRANIAAPLIIDGPFTYLDTYNALETAHMLKKGAGNAQLILVMSNYDRERKVDKIFASAIAVRREIVWAKTEGIALIRRQNT